MSQRKADPFAAMVSSVLLSAKVQYSTDVGWLISLDNGSAEDVSQMRAVLSAEVVAMRLESVEKTKSEMRDACCTASTNNSPSRVNKLRV